MLHLVLFRGGARGGEHARARREESFSRRTGLFFRGEYEELIRGYLAEREKRRPRHTPSGEDASIAEIEKLIACGNLSKAARRCVSTGLGDLEDPRVVAQLAAKHRARDGDIPEFDFKDRRPPARRRQPGLHQRARAATTTHASTTGSKLTYTLAGDSSPVTLMAPRRNPN